MAKTITLHAWMLVPGDMVNGKIVRYEPVYTNSSKTHVRIDYTDGTSETFAHRADVAVTEA